MNRSKNLRALALAALLPAVGCATGDDGAEGALDAASGTTVDANGPSTKDAGTTPLGDDGGSDTTLPDDDSGPAPAPLDANADDATTLDGASTRDDAGHPSNGPDASGPDASVPDASGLDASHLDASPADAAPPETLIAKWTFDENTGTTSADLSGHGHTITFASSATWGPVGKEGTALSLDGISAYADTGITLINTSQSFTVAAWVKLTVANSWETALSQDFVNGSLFGLKLRGDGTDAFDFDVETSDVTTPGYVVSQSTTTATVQTWYHLAGVYDATGTGSLKMYTNGALQANAAALQSVLASTGHFVIGRGLGGGVKGSFFNGMIDDVEVYSSALTDAQVQALYASQE